MSAADTWDHAGHVVASTYRRTTLDELADQPATPSTIAEATGIDIAHVSRALADLRERDLVELLVPDSRKKGRIYGLTDRGRTVRDHVAELEGSVDDL